MHAEQGFMPQGGQLMDSNHQQQQQQPQPGQMLPQMLKHHQQQHDPAPMQQMGMGPVFISKKRAKIHSAEKNMLSRLSCFRRARSTQATSFFTITGCAWSRKILRTKTTWFLKTEFRIVFF